MTIGPLALPLLRSCALTLLIAVAFAACGGDDDPDDMGVEANDPPPPDCAERCSAKATSCSAPAGVAQGQCGSLCDGSLTETQLDCLEGSSCAVLDEVFFGSGIACGIGSPSAGSSGGGDDNADDGANAKIGDDCECSGADVGFESCAGSTSACGSLTCYVTRGEGICSQGCTADINGDDCPRGECTQHFINGVDVGTWCAT